MRYAIVVEKPRAGTALCAGLPGAPQPETESEVIAAIREGIEIYIEELKARGGCSK